MAFDALFNWRCDVVETDGALHEWEETCILHRPELDVLEPAKERQIHRGTLQRLGLRTGFRQCPNWKTQQKYFIFEKKSFHNI